MNVKVLYISSIESNIEGNGLVNINTKKVNTLKNKDAESWMMGALTKYISKRGSIMSRREEIIKRKIPNLESSHIVSFKKSSIERSDDSKYPLYTS